MNGETTGPTIIGALQAALQSLWKHRTPVLGLLVLYFVIVGLMFFAALDLLAGLFEALGYPQPLEAAAAEAPEGNLLPAIVITIAIGFIGGGVLMALIGRLIALGRERMFEGGLPAFARRVLWVTWRLVEWTILLALAYLPLYLLLTITNWLYGLGAGGTWQDLVTILHMVLATALIALSVLAIFAVVSLTIWAACQDQRLGVVEAWSILKGLRLRLMLTIFLILAMTTLIAVALLWVAAMLFPEPGTIHYLTGLLGLGIADFTTGYLWLALGGQYARAIGLGAIH